MSGRTLWSHILVIVGLLAMLVGAIDPLEGSFVIFPGSGSVAMGGFLGKSWYRKLLYAAFILIAAGFGVMIVMTMVGGIGGSTGRSMWWALFILPYPIGWIMGLSELFCDSLNRQGKIDMTKSAHQERDARMVGKSSSCLPGNPPHDVTVIKVEFAGQPTLLCEKDKSAWLNGRA